MEIESSAEPAPQDTLISSLEKDVRDLESMHILFGGALIIITIVLTGVVCVVGNIQIPFVSAYFAPAGSMYSGTMRGQGELQSPGSLSVPNLPSLASTTASSTGTGPK